MKVKLTILFCLACSVGYSQPKKTRNLVWSDEFNYDGVPDTTKWDYDLGSGNPEGWGNNELEYYTNNKKNVRIENGNLVLEVHKETLNAKNYTSTRIHSKKKNSWLYGRIEVKAKLPSGRGTWPAIWMLSSQWKYGGWPGSGEIDIMEHVGYDPGVVHGTIHTESYNHTKQTQKEGIIKIESACSSFHVYTLDWSPNTMEFFVDDELYETITRDSNEDYKGWPFDQPFYLIMNVAVGGGWGGKQGVDDSIWPQRMEIDYVRIYQ